MQAGDRIDREIHITRVVGAGVLAGVGGIVTGERLRAGAKVGRRLARDDFEFVAAGIRPRGGGPRERPGPGAGLYHGQASPPPRRPDPAVPEVPPPGAVA